VLVRGQAAWRVGRLRGQLRRLLRAGRGTLQGQGESEIELRGRCEVELVPRRLLVGPRRLPAHLRDLPSDPADVPRRQPERDAHTFPGVTPDDRADDGPDRNAHSSPDSGAHARRWLRRRP